MRHKITYSALMLMLALSIAGCGEKTIAENHNTHVKQEVKTGPILEGKILFTVLNKGIYVYENGQTRLWKKDAFWPMALSTGDIVFGRPSIRKDAELGHKQTDYFIASFENPEDEKVYLEPSERILLLGTLASQNVHYGRLWTEGRNGFIGNIILYDMTKKKYENLTNFEAAGVTFMGASMSPDGQKLAYSASIRDYIEGKIKKTDHSVIINLMGNVVEELPEYTDTPAWSPDGKEIAMAKLYLANEKTEKGNDTDIVLYNLETKALKRLTFTENIKSDPTFSPDGSKIAFIDWGAGGRYKNLAVINRDGTGYQTLIPDELADANVIDIEWAP